MKTDKLIDAIGMIDDKKISNAKSINRTVKKRSLKKTIVLVAAVILCFALSFTTLAATVDPFYQMLYRVSPTLAQALKPVNLSSVDNGIKMEVLSAAIHENEAVIYITLQDLEQDRIDNTVDLFDSYRINRPFDSSASCQRIGFDEETKKATFMISISQWNNEKISGDKITFSFREFLSKKSIFEGELTGLNIYNAKSVVGVKIPNPYENAKILDGKIKEEYERYETVRFLPTAKNGIYIPTESVKITGMGFVDNKLHIQVYYEDISIYDNHGYIKLIDENGNSATCKDYVFRSDKDNCRYTELIYEISPEEINNYTAYGYFVTTKTKTEGNWQVTFPLKIKISQSNIIQKAPSR